MTNARAAVRAAGGRQVVAVVRRGAGEFRLVPEVGIAAGGMTGALFVVPD